MHELRRVPHLPSKKHPEGIISDSEFLISDFLFFNFKLHTYFVVYFKIYRAGRASDAGF